MPRTGFRSASDAHIRCSDAERERVAGFLRDRAAEGRLTPDELAERVGQAYRAVTIGELERLVYDLPGSPVPAAQPRRPARRLQPAILAVALVALVAVLMPGPLWILWLGGVGIAFAFAFMALALGLALGPFALVAAAVVFALRRLGGRETRPPVAR